MGQPACTLPGGYVDREGTVHRDVEFHPLSGRQEEILAESGKSGSAHLMTTVLSQCVDRIGGINPVTEDVVRGLLVADRQYLLLKLRAATFGERVQGTIYCPWPDCGKKTDIDFSILDVPVRESRDKGPLYTMQLSADRALTDEAGNTHTDIAFRLPIGEDQEIISPVAVENEAKALSMLLERCLLRVGSLSGPGAEVIDGLSPAARREIEQAMEEAAPKVDLTMSVACSECRREFPAPFDLQDFFFGELRSGVDMLYREVHYLAYHYHWSEREIMEMPVDKRRTYLEVLTDEIERLNDAV